MPAGPRRVYADPRVMADVGRVAIMEGPIVLCLEGVDQSDTGRRARNIVLPRESHRTERVELGPSLRGSRWTDAVAVEGTRGALRMRRIAASFTPYCDWDNRDPREMVVWIPETPELAELLGESGSVVSNGVRLAASHCWSTDKLEALNDGRLPSASNDESIPRMTWWDHRGTVEWVSCEFPEPRELSFAVVWWFDDQPRGGCAVPASWRLLWRDGEEWRPVELAAGSSFGVSKDGPNEARFARVRARAVKLEVTLASKRSAGILEWRLGGP
jgi:uncharacterized protein